VQRVDFLVLRPYLYGCGQVTPVITVDDLSKLVQNALRHRPQSNRNLISPLFVAKLYRTLCNVRGKIANTLKIACDSQSADNFTQIDSQWLSARNRADCPCLNVVLKRIDRNVFNFNRLG
jgi:hypothetical protein